jgi:hypothetical protein
VTAVVFTGPTLPAEAAAALLPGAVVVPPARQGDVFRAVRDRRPRAVGIIDGVFLHEPAVWHREILWALSEGVHVFGAASMGALRAAELAQFGMRGVGRVFESYVAGAWPGFADAFEDDDEVAVVHAPAELGAAPLSEALVDLRDTLLAAEAAGLLSQGQRNALLGALKALAFPQRGVRGLADLAGTHLDPAGAARLRAWLPDNQVARKRQDAEAMLSVLADFLRTEPPPFAPAFRFETVQVWEDFTRSDPPVPSAEEAMVLEELRLLPDDWGDAARSALARLLAADVAAPGDAALRRATDAFRRSHGIARRADLLTWLGDNATTDARLTRMLRDEAALTEAIDAAPPGLDAAIADHLRLTGAFAALLRRGRAKSVAVPGPPPPGGPEADAALVWFAGRCGIELAALRKDGALAAAVWREYVFQRRLQ